MKKRLLITSIVMMLVVAVALSTATYAWFTSSTTVTSSAISLTAAVNEEASLGISWTDGNFGPSITAASPQGGSVFKPAAPATLTVGTTNSEVVFNTALATPTTGGDMIFKAGSIDTTTVYTWTDDTLPANAATAHNSFFIGNLSPSNPIDSIIVTATISDVDTTTDEIDASKLVRVGIFRKDPTTSTYKLLGVMANQEGNTYSVVATESDPVVMDGAAGTYFKKVLGKYVAAVPGDATEVADGTADYEIGVTNVTTSVNVGKFYTRTNTPTDAQVTYGTITAGTSVNAQTTTACTNAVTGIQLLDTANNEELAAGASIEIVVLVWEDAAALGDAEGGVATSISLSFGA